MKQLTFRSLIVVPVLLGLLCVPSITLADPITWNLSGVVFDDGGTASGSFVYDAVTNTFGAINIVTTAGSSFAGATYTAVDPGFGPQANSMVFVPNPNLADFTGTTLLDLEFGSSLTNLGGTFGFTTEAFEGFCDGMDPAINDCSSFTGPFRGMTGEVVSAASVPTPEPSALLLLGMGLVGLARAAKHKVSQA